ncbi:MAG: AMP-binding protein [Alphaproteobacteria bacterium]|nr:AMP-binding protein [Alphaproteobacteria bacterium]
MRFFDQLRQNLASHPDRRSLTWYDRHARVTATMSVAEQHARARGLAGALLEAGCRPGEVVLLIYPPGVAFFDAFLACLYAGIIPAALYPPDPRENERLGALSTICERLGARVALTDTLYDRARRLGAVAGLLRRGPRWPKLRWIRTDALSPAAPPPDRDAAPEDLAFVQLTSGSTSAPKGVGVRFGELVHQMRINFDHGQVDADSRAVIWLPQYHDFGLVTSFLSSLYTPFSLWCCSPLDFLARPACWPEMMHAAKATHTASPNFGFALVTRKTTPEQRAAWDLSSMRCATWGAEVIRPETVEGFAEAFAVSGLDRRSLVSGWGLAEHVVAAAVAPTEVRSFDGAALRRHGVLTPAPPESPDALRLANAGGVLPSVELAVVDPERRVTQPEGVVGEIWLRGAGVTAGYLNDLEATEASFGARLQEGGAPWLRSGDQGAVLEGRLYITGRLKELIILRGRNLHPTDVEAAARGAHPAIRPGGVAAVALRVADTEALGLAVELAEPKRWKADYAAIAEDIRAALAREGFPLHRLALLAPRSIPKTTSGKLQRQRCAAQLAEGSLGGRKGLLLDRSWDAEAQAGGLSTDLIEALRTLPEFPVAQRPAAARRALEGALVQRTGAAPATLTRADVTLMELGLDSLAIAALMEEITALVGVAPEGAARAELVRLDRLSEWLAEAVSAPRAAAEPAEPAALPAFVPATPFQNLLLRDHGEHPAWFGVFEVLGPMAPEAPRAALETLLRRHALLRARPMRLGTELLLQVSAEPPEVHVVEVQGADDAERLALLSEALRQPMSLDKPPLLRLGLSPCGPDRALLGVSAHHLIYDAVSIQELLHQLLVALSGMEEELDAPCFLAHAWAMSQRPPSTQDAAWWAAQLRGARWPRPAGEAVTLTEHRLLPVGEFALDAERSAALAALAQQNGATLNTAACLGWALAMASVLGEEELLTGCAVSTRDAAQRHVIGPLVDDVLLRLRLPAEASGARLLREAGEALRQSAARVDYGFDNTLSGLGPQDGGNQVPCPALYSFYDWDGLAPRQSATLLQRGAWLPMGALRLRGLPVERRNPERPYDYFATAELRDGRLGAALRVQHRRVGAEAGALILQRWEAALGLLLEDPARPAAALLDALARQEMVS